jgi:hypothetical protein
MDFSERLELTIGFWIYSDFSQGEIQAVPYIV